MIGDAKIPVWCDRCEFEEWRDLTPLASRHEGVWGDRNVADGLKRDGWRVEDDGKVTICPECIEQEEQE